MAIPLKDCKQCSHYRGGYCYGFGTAKQVVSTSIAIMCGTYTPLGQVQIGPLDSLAGQLKDFQIPTEIISTIKLADLAVTSAKLANDSVILSKIADLVITDAKIAAGAAIAESKLDLAFSTTDLNTDIQTRLLAATYTAHDHSLADPTQVDFNNLLNINPLVLAGYLRVDTGLGIGIVPDATRIINIVKTGTQQIFLRSIDNDANICIRSGVGKDAALMFYEDTVAKGLFYYDASQNRFKFYSYASLDYLALPDGGGIELGGDVTVTGNVSIAATKTVDGVDVSEEPARITAEIATHAGLPTAHQDAPALITTHAGLPTAHQDAPALIATHAADPDAHHSHSGSGELASSAWSCIIPFLTDGAHTSQGSWELTADGSVYINIEAMLPRSLPAGTIRIDNIYIYFETNDNACYLNASYVYKVKLDTKDLTSIHLNSNNTGEGSTGDHTRTIALNYTRESGYGLATSFSVESTTGTFNFHGIKVTYTVL